jgi:hypothetical protein
MCSLIIRQVVGCKPIGRVSEVIFGGG